jgi:hypothetical protein
MTRIAFCRKSPRVPGVRCLGSWPWEPASEDGEDGKGKAPPSVRRMWLVELRFYEATRALMPSLRAETSGKSTHRAPSIFESGR